MAEEVAAVESLVDMDAELPGFDHQLKNDAAARNFSRRWRPAGAVA